MNAIFMSVFAENDLSEVLGYIVGEIPFIILMAVLVYFFWIRPKRIKKREAADKNRELQVGDELLFSDGMLGLFVRQAEEKVYIESGSKHTKFCCNAETATKNLSMEERVKSTRASMKIWQKIAEKI